MLEKDILKKIVEYLRSTGWKVFKINDRFTYGIPDLYTVKNGRSIWFEVKAPRGKVSKIQEKSFNDLINHGAELYVVDSLEKVKNILGLQEAG